MLYPIEDQETPSILIAEDSPTQTEQLRIMLERHGYLVISALDGKQALEAARECKPTLLISDVMMPIMNGYELCKALKSDPVLREIPVILVTELSQPQDVVLGLECGADNFIRKPFEEKYLIQRVRHLLANRALRNGDKIQMGLEIDLHGRRYFVTAERQQILHLLISTYEEAVILKQTLENSMQSLHGLYRIAEGLNECATQHDTINIVLDRVTELLGIAAAWMYRCEDQGKRTFVGSRGLSPALKERAAATCPCNGLSEGSRRPQLVNPPATSDDAKLPSHVMVPLWGKNGLFGSLHLARQNQERFTEDDLEILHGVGQQVGLALERARLLEELESLVDKRTAALRESEQWFRGVFQAQADAVFALGADYSIVDANQAALRAFGHALESLRGQSAEILHLDASSYAAFQNQLLEAFRDSDTAAFECDFLRQDGTTFPGEQTLTKLHGANGESLGFVQVIRDLTARRLAAAKLASVQEQFQHAQRMESLGVLAGGIAHDMNNILSAVIGFSDMALSTVPEDSEFFSDLQCIKESGERGAKLVGQILAFSRKQVLAPAILDINDVVARFRKMIARLIGEHIEIRTNLADGLHKVLADDSKLEQILMNLAVNARDAMPNGGTLVIETSNVHFDRDYQIDHVTVKEGEYVMLSVADTGAGMDRETQRRIFEPFFTTKAHGQGTGLGLATVYGIVDQHKGYIHVYSEIGMGTIFKIYLPVTERADKPVELQPVKRVVRTGNETILVAEDDPIVRRLVRIMLTNQGYTVLEADGPEAAIQLAESYKDAISLLVTDVIMPGMNGRELHRRLSEGLPGLKVLFTSGYSHDIMNVHALLESNYHYLPKPFSADELANGVRSAIESP